MQCMEQQSLQHSKNTASSYVEEKSVSGRRKLNEAQKIYDWQFADMHLAREFCATCP